MRTVPTSFLPVLAGPVQTWAWCIRVNRKDGVSLGFTTHDRPLVLDGLTYEPQSAIAGTAFQAKEGTEADNMNLFGALDSARIRDTDLAAGRYDDADLILYQVNWAQAPLVDRMLLARGNLGQVQFGNGGYQAEFRSLMQRMQQNIGELCSPICRVRQLFDGRCSPPASATPTATPADFRSDHAVIDLLTDQAGLTFGANSQPTGWYDYGLCTMRTGENAGIAREIKEHVSGTDRAIIYLQEPFPFPVALGDSATLEAGCDRTFTTCRSKFGNAINFQGEPDVPGTDQVIQIGRRS